MPPTDTKIWRDVTAECECGLEGDPIAYQGKSIIDLKGYLIDGYRLRKVQVRSEEQFMAHWAFIVERAE